MAKALASEISCENWVSPSRLAHSYTAFLANHAQGKGIDPDILLSEVPCGLSRRWNNRDLALISRSLKLATADDFFGLVENGKVPVHGLRFAFEICTLSETLGAALSRAFQFIDLACSGVHFALEVNGDAVALTLQTCAVDPKNAQFLAEWQLWYWRHIAQWCIGRPIPLIQADFPFAPIADLADYAAPFGSRGYFQTGRARLLLPAKALAHPVVKSPLDLAQLFKSTSVPLTYSPQQPTTVRGRLTDAIRASLQHTGRIPTLDELASQFGVCGQTLRRHLGCEGISYRALKEGVRRDLAMELHNSGTKGLDELAGRIGYAETASVSRALRRWSVSAQSH